MTQPPIFVAGMNRSGTKWLSNLLANHPDVAAVQTERHTGILETNAFEAWPQRFPRLSEPDEYVAFIELWSRTDFFRTTGVEKEFFYGLDPRPTSHLELFGALMDRFAEHTGKRRWLQKVGPWSAPAVLDHFRGARAVVIERNREDTLRSTHFLETQGSRTLALRTIASHQLQERILHGLCDRGALGVRYEDLRADPEGELRRLCTGLGLEPHPGMLELPWQKNTSFRTGEARRYEFSAAERRKIRVCGWLVERLPESALRAARRRFRRESPVVEGTFGEIKEEHDLR